MMLKDILKRILYSSGLLPLVNRLKNRQNLTIVMFHRVIGEKDPRWRECNLEWTLSDTVFKECLGFFKRHYTIVSLEELVQSFKGAGRLPDNPLLITFDDGWSDNYQYAFPLLKQLNLPASIFLAGSAIDRPEPFWEERIWGAYKTGSLNQDRIKAFAARYFSRVQIKGELEDQTLKQVISLISQDRAIQAQFINEIVNDLPLLYKDSYMLSSKQIQHMAGHRISFGGHGYSHFPLTSVEDEDEELKKSITALTRVLPELDMNSLSMSLPHGRFSGRTLDSARKNGFQLIFTSEKGRVALKERCLTTDVLNRYPVFFEEITSSKGLLLNHKLAFQLFL